MEPSTLDVRLRPPDSGGVSGSIPSRLEKPADRRCPAVWPPVVSPAKALVRASSPPLPPPRLGFLLRDMKPRPELDAAPEGPNSPFVAAAGALMGGVPYARPDSELGRLPALSKQVPTPLLNPTIYHGSANIVTHASSAVLHVY